MTKDYLRELQSAKEAAKQAGSLIKSMKGSAGVSEKAMNNLVTEADLSSEKLIGEMLLDRFPDSILYGEEDEKRGAIDSDSLWLIDPLDGTNNYAHGIPVYCVSIAYAQKGDVKCAVVYDPEREELFSAVKGGGAFLNDKRIGVSKRSTLQESIITAGFYYERGELMERTLEAIGKLFRLDVRGFRRTGSAAIDLCWVSCGRFDGYFEYMLSPWDFAAGSLIVSEAGGIIQDRNANPFSLLQTGAIASNGFIHEQLIKTVAFDSDKRFN
ncbi:inositol monophosphatase family protein [Chitinispirillales bacterium ANBcel5]|uniref:inositol monophosphatase family protein n=1 Tax=Cellulosispirillum alkaliphilum TaxID=3039283 RepID=UPI002A5586F1|nr:inositol monophosphatase family protein [Chitinispirillales bacterium ANBcel5]